MIGRWKRHEIKRNRKTIRLGKEVDGKKLTQKQIEKAIEAELPKKKAGTGKRGKKKEKSPDKKSG